MPPGQQIFNKFNEKEIKSIVLEMECVEEDGTESQIQKLFFP